MSGASCGCCDCLSGITPVAASNRHGLSAISVRAGTHATFLETMLADLSSASVPSVAALTTRESSDPAVAILDAWATVADVLTFYQERIANEGYLRTATERRSLVELGRLVGYELRPGVAASVFLAYTIQDDFVTEIPAGSKVQSVPAPGEKPQTFETSETLQASWQWNAMKPRPSRPRRITLAGFDVYTVATLDFTGTATNLEPQDPLLFVFGTAPMRQVMRVVKNVALDHEAGRTTVTLQEFSTVAIAFIELARATMAKIAAAGFTGADRDEANKLQRILIDGIRWANVAGAATSRIEVIVKLAAIRIEIQGVGANRPALDPFKTEFDQLAEALMATPPGATPTKDKPVAVNVGEIVEALLVDPNEQPISARHLPRDVDAFREDDSEARFQVIQSVWPKLRQYYSSALAGAVLEPVIPELDGVFVMRETAAPFGYNAPLLTAVNPGDPPSVPATVVTQEHTLAERDRLFPIQLYLDTIYSKIEPESWVVVRTPHPSLLLQTASGFVPTIEGEFAVAGAGAFFDLVRDAKPLVAQVVETVTRTDYNLTSKTTLLTFDEPWFRSSGDKITNNFRVLRQSTILVQSEPLTLAEELIEDDVSGAEIELDRYYSGLKPGRWLAFEGERTDIPGTTGVIDREVVMIAGVQHKSASGETPHTIITLAGEGLAHTYVRSTVTINGNVTKATHGESVIDEPVGSGDASKSMQQMSLKRAPLTFVSAPTPSGVASTLVVRVDSIAWDETESFTGLEATAHVYETKISNGAQTMLVFGNGKQGARLPTGSDNVKATYRVGLGRAGNLAAGQLSLLISRPLGASKVGNPLASSGGADPESIRQARANIPVALLALDRLVSERDYADLTRTFGGVAKARATTLPGGLLPLVHVTIAGDGDAEIDVNSDLYKNLVEALRTWGDPFQQVIVAARERIIVAIYAKVRIDSHYLWDNVEPQIRALLLDRFGFESRDLGQRLYASEIVAAIQSVPGVEFVDLEPFRSISMDNVLINRLSLPQLPIATKFRHSYVDARLARVDRAGNPRAAQLVYLASDAPDTLVLEEIKP